MMNYCYQCKTEIPAPKVLFAENQAEPFCSIECVDVYRDQRESLVDTERAVDAAWELNR